MVNWLDAILELLRHFAPTLAEYLNQQLQDRRERKDMLRELKAREAARQAVREQQAADSLGADAGAWLRATRRMHNHKP